MIEVLNFIFQDFWHWLGVAILIYIVICWTPVQINTTYEEEKKNEGDA